MFQQAFKIYKQNFRSVLFVAVCLFVNDFLYLEENFELISSTIMLLIWTYLAIVIHAQLLDENIEYKSLGFIRLLLGFFFRSTVLTIVSLIPAFIIVLLLFGAFDGDLYFYHYIYIGITYLSAMIGFAGLYARCGIILPVYVAGKAVDLQSLYNNKSVRFGKTFKQLLLGPCFITGITSFIWYWFDEIVYYDIFSMNIQSEYHSFLHWVWLVPSTFIEAFSVVMMAMILCNFYHSIDFEDR